MLVTNDYVFFWKGVFSQWYKSSFFDDNGDPYNCAEQYMMYHKAMLFDDGETADKIMNASMPREIQLLGRQVKNFDQSIWDTTCRKIVFEGNCLKYTQDDYCLNALKDTRDRLLVEASPFDRIWGIGFAEDEAEGKKDKWGKNYLGKIITDVRDYIL